MMKAIMKISSSSASDFPPAFGFQNLGVWDYSIYQKIRIVECFSLARISILHHLPGFFCLRGYFFPAKSLADTFYSTQFY